MRELNSSPLFELIKSLTGHEKRYFKIFASRHIIGEANIYVSLFDIIDGQDIYSEKNIFAANKKIKKSQFHNIKKYLYDVILKSLDSFHINDTNETKLRYMIHQVKILYEKGLYTQAEKIIRSAKKIALSYELYTAYIDLVHWERAIYNNSPRLKKIESYFTIVSKEERGAIEKLRMFNEIKTVQGIIFSISIQGRSSIETDKMKKQWPLLKNIIRMSQTNKLTFDMLRFLYNACIIYYRAMEDPKKNFLHCKKLVELFDNNPERYEQNVEPYISALNNYTIAADAFNKKELPKIVHRLKKIYETNPQVKRSILLRSRIFHMTSLMQMELFITKGEFKQCALLIDKEFEIQLKEYDKVIPILNKWILYYCFALIYFGAEKYKESLAWLNKLFNNRDVDRQQDIASVARILNLIIHLEYKNNEHLQYILKSTLHFLTRKRTLSKVEKCILDKFKKITKTNSVQEVQQLYIILKNELIPFQKNINEKVVFDYFDIISWLDSKIEKRSFAEIIKAKAQS